MVSKIDIGGEEGITAIKLVNDNQVLCANGDGLVKCIDLRSVSFLLRCI